MVPHTAAQISQVRLTAAVAVPRVVDGAPGLAVGAVHAVQVACSDAPGVQQSSLRTWALTLQHSVVLRTCGTSCPTPDTVLVPSNPVVTRQTIQWQHAHRAKAQGRLCVPHWLPCPAVLYLKCSELHVVKGLLY